MPHCWKSHAAAQMSVWTTPFNVSTKSSGPTGFNFYCIAVPFCDVYEPRHEISNNVVCATSKASDQSAHTRSLIRAFASRLNILWMLSYWLTIIWSFWAKKEAAQARSSLHMSKCHNVGNHISRLIYGLLPPFHPPSCLSSTKLFQVTNSAIKSKWVWSANPTITHCRPTHGTVRKSHITFIVTLQL